MPAARSVRAGLVGCGRLAELGYLPAFALARGIDLVAVAEPDPGRRALAGVAGYASTADLLASERLDALVLASPAAAHVADARLAAAAGVATLVEKPPAPDAAGAESLTRLEPTPWIGFNRRFEPALQALRGRVPASGTLSLDLRLRVRPSSWRPYVVVDDVLLDLGPHLVDLALWLSGERIAGVRGRLGARDAHLSLELADGRGRAEIRCARGRSYAERIEIAGVGRYRAGGASGLLRRGRHPLVESLARQLEAFARAARGRDELDLATAADGLAVMAVLDEARARQTRSAGSAAS
jgi:predicted dehydrogenase